MKAERWQKIESAPGPANRKLIGVRSVWFLALVVGFAVRLAPIAAAKPYIAYINEGNFLHPAVRILRGHGWDPGAYDYPQFPRMAVAAVMKLYAPVYARIRGKKLTLQYSPEPGIYDELEPFDLLVVARIMSVLVSMGIVILTGILALRLGGIYAGTAAVVLTALTPALVVRSGFAVVDPYAALFVIACLLTTDISRTSSRPGLLSFASGFLAGCAFASKYPAVIVGIAFVVTTLILRIEWRAKAMRIGLAAAGLIVGIIMAMPAVVTHARYVYAAILDQAASYAALTTPTLWQQAIHNAEPDMPYSGTEMGPIFLGLAVIGFGLALIDRRLAPTAWGWLTFVALSLALFGSRPYQPLRNLLPLVPVACIVIALLYDRVRERMRLPGWTDAFGAVVVVGLFAVPLAQFDWERMHVVDTRTTVVDWLAANAQPQDGVIIVRELAFVNSELARLRNSPRVEWQRDAERAIIESKPRFVVAGVFMQENSPWIDMSTLPSITTAYSLRLRLGEGPTAPEVLWWRGNRELIFVFERTPSAVRD